jgi:hypothetical protein
MRPSDAIATRRVMFENLDAFWTREANRPEGTPETCPPQIMQALAHAVRILPDASIYLVTEEMSDLAIRAASTLPDAVHVADLPADSGLILFERAIGSFPMTAEDSDEPGEPMPVLGAVWHFTKFQGGGEGIALAPLGKSRESSVLLPMPIATWGTGCGNNGDGPWPMYNDYSGAAAVVHAAWAIMQQTLAVSAPAHADRAESRRSARAGLPSDLIVVHLRKRRVEDPDPDDTGSVVDWSHRWLVGGHWRNQWLPSRSCHRPMWIDPYVKGPDDKPLVLKAKVHVWSQ